MIAEEEYEASYRQKKAKLFWQKRLIGGALSLSLVSEGKLFPPGRMKTCVCVFYAPNEQTYLLS